MTRRHERIPTLHEALFEAYCWEMMVEGIRMTTPDPLAGLDALPTLRELAGQRIIDVPSLPELWDREDARDWVAMVGRARELAEVRAWTKGEP